MSTIITAGNPTNGLSLSADNTGILEFKTGNGAGTTALTLSATQATTFASTVAAGAITSTGTIAAAAGTLYPLLSGTVQTPTTASADFTGIPSWVKRITVLLSDISTSGTNTILIRIGSGSFETTSYTGTVSRQSPSGNTNTAFTTGFLLTDTNTAANAWSGAIRLTNLTGNTWVCDGIQSNGLGSTSAYVSYISGFRALSGVLDRVQLITSSTNVFDGGSVNILYE